MNFFITEHARKRMKQRHIIDRDIENVLTYGTPTHSQGNLKYTYNHFIIITNNHNHDNIVIVSVYYTKAFNRQAEKLSKQLHITFRQAIKTLRELENKRE